MPTMPSATGIGFHADANGTSTSTQTERRVVVGDDREHVHDHEHDRERAEEAVHAEHPPRTRASTEDAGRVEEAPHHRRDDQAPRDDAGAARARTRRDARSLARPTAHAANRSARPGGVHGAVVVDEVPGRLVLGEQRAAARRALEERGLGQHLGPPRAAGEHRRSREPAGRRRAGARVDEVVTTSRRRAPHAAGAPRGRDRAVRRRTCVIDRPVSGCSRSTIQPWSSGASALDPQVAAEVDAHAVDVARHHARRRRDRRRSPCRSRRGRSARRAADGRRRRRGRR